MKSMFIPYISEYEIIEIIKSLKNSSAGYDNIPASIAKQCIQHYIKPLKYLTNSSFDGGIFSNELKLAKVIPIFKNGDKQDEIIGRYQYYLYFLKYLRKLCITI